MVGVITDFLDGHRKIYALREDECEINEDGVPSYSGFDGDAAGELRSDLPCTEEETLLKVFFEIDRTVSSEEWDDCLAILFGYRFKVRTNDEVYYFK